MITTNQTKQWCKSNKYFQHWLTCRDLEEPLEHLTLSDRFRRKYKRQAKNIDYEVQYEKFVDRRVISVSDYCRNVNYNRAWREFEYKFKELLELCAYHHTIYSGKFMLNDDWCFLEWQSRCTMKSNGTWYIEISQCREDDKSYIKFPFIGENTQFDYNGILDSEHIANASRNHIEKYLYPEGNFRAFQILHLCDKERVKDVYRYQIQNRKWYETDYSELEQNTTAWIKRNFNIDISNVDFDRGIDCVNRMGKQSKMTVLRRFDYSFADQLDGDIGELEMAYWEDIDTYEPNAYFIN